MFSRSLAEKLLKGIGNRSQLSHLFQPAVAPAEVSALSLNYVSKTGESKVALSLDLLKVLQQRSEPLQAYASQTVDPLRHRPLH